MARFFPFFPPRSANFRPQRRRSLSAPNGPRMWCAPFHEKAGRSQVVSLSFLFVTRFFSAELPTVATLPSALFDERVFSLGASWVFSFQPVLPPDCRPPVPSEMEVGPGD